MPKQKKPADQLVHVRGAIHGWAFTGVNNLKRKIECAELERDKLPPELHPQANAIINPLKRELRKYV
jgi:hypothetical protein